MDRQGRERVGPKQTREVIWQRRAEGVPVRNGYPGWERSAVSAAGGLVPEQVPLVTQV